MRLRALHAVMDRAVLDAYGSDDVRPTYDFRAQLDERVVWGRACRVRVAPSHVAVAWVAAYVDDGHHRPPRR